MKKFLSATALAALPFSAFAADLPKRAVSPAPVLALSQQWTGFYAGVVAGYAGLNSFIDDGYGANTLDRFNETGFRHRPTGFAGGIAAGYNWRLGRIVYGLEADVSGSTLSKQTLDV